MRNKMCSNQFYEFVNYYDFYFRIADKYAVAFKIYEANKSIFFVSRLYPSSIISVDCDNIIGMVDHRETLTIMTRVGQISLTPNGNSITNLFTKKQTR